MYILAAILLVTATPDGAKPQKPPTKEQQAADEAKKKADEEASARAAAALAAEKAAAEAKQKADAEEAAKAAEIAKKKAEADALAARGLEARVRVLCDQIAIPLKRLPGDYREQRFAVLPLEEAGAEAVDKHLGAVVGDLVVTDLARDHHLALVERAALARILDEQALGQSGAIADGQAAQIGKIAGARALIIGQIADAGDAFRVSLRAVDAEAGTIIDGTARDVSLPKDELIAFSASAVVLKSKSGALFRSVVAPGWGQAYNGDGAKAVVFGVAGYGGLLTTAALGVGGIVVQTHYNDTAYFEKLATSAPAKAGQEAVDARNTFTALYTSTAIAGGITAALWGINAIDAYLSGTDVENLDAALARN